MDASRPSGLNTNPLTLTSYIIEEQRNYKEASGDFTLLMQSIQTACKFIASKVKKAGIANLYGLAGAENTSGDQVKKLDVIANEVFINCLLSSKKVAVMISEENEKPIEIPVEDQGNYFIAFDPLDGSSNIDANVSIGSIFSIWRRKSDPHTPITEADWQRNGSDILAAGYCLYGSSTHFLLATQGKVSIFTLDPSLGEFILSHNNVKIPNGKDKKKIYSINEGNAMIWEAATTEYINTLKFPKSGSPYSLRYIGSMVADVHRTILYGGIFLYPGDTKSPEGKLRVLYECFPMAFILEQCGGHCVTGTMRLLDIEVKKPHQRTGIILGSPDDISAVQTIYDKHRK